LTAPRRDFPASVWEVVLSGCHAKQFHSTRSKARENMEKLGVWGLKNRAYSELSGGQQQRVLLARALCAAYRLIILDEPAAGLDPIMSNELYRLIKQINADGMTVIMVSHDIDAAIKYASYILHLHNKPLFFGPAADYVECPVCRKFMAD